MSVIPASVVVQIKKRDGDMCAKCGRFRSTDSHHRMRRRDGEHTPSNLVRLCRSCHAFVHDNPREAREFGWIIPALRKPPLQPACVPVRYQFGWVLLDDQVHGGTVAAWPVADATAIELLVRFDMRKAAA